jgi:hypothetical protein
VSAVGVVSTAAGLVIIYLRGATLVATAPTLRWVTGALRRSGAIRLMGMVILALGAAMVWAGASEDRTLATILSIGGVAWIGLGIGALLSPGPLRGLVKAILPPDPGDRLTLWRLGGLKVIPGVLLIYFGVRAL